MPKAAPGSRVSARLSSPGAGGVGEDGLLEGQTEGEAALEAVGELDGKFEEWHLQAKQDAVEAKAASAVHIHFNIRAIGFAVTHLVTVKALDFGFIPALSLSSPPGPAAFFRLALATRSFSVTSTGTVLVDLYLFHAMG